MAKKRKLGITKDESDKVQASLNRAILTCARRMESSDRDACILGVHFVDEALFQEGVKKGKKTSYTELGRRSGKKRRR